MVLARAAEYLSPSHAQAQISQQDEDDVNMAAAAVRESHTRLQQPTTTTDTSGTATAVMGQADLGLDGVVDFDDADAARPPYPHVSAGLLYQSGRKKDGD